MTEFVKVSPFVLLLLSMSLIGCNKDKKVPEIPEAPEEVYEPEIAPGNGVTDINGNEYGSVNIGNQEWMTENLRTTLFSNGDAIPLVANAESWVALSTAARSEYDEDPQHTAIFGYYYNAYAVHDERGLCPDGWRVPDSTDFHILKMHLDPTANNFDDDAGGMLKTTGNVSDGTGLWNFPNTGASNLSGFSAEAGGFRDNSGAFGGMGISGNLWIRDPQFSTSTEHLTAHRLYSMYKNTWLFTTSPVSGICVRCIKD